MRINYHSNIFINCPFDEKYKPILDALVFAIYDFGCIPRCALEDSGTNAFRIDKIVKIMEECKYGIHDISRVEIDKAINLPRFNMPYELGIFDGAIRFGNKRQKEKEYLVFDKERYRYRNFISDIAGQDIRAHNNKPGDAIHSLRNWLSNKLGTSIPTGDVVAKRYVKFVKEFPLICKELKLTPKHTIFTDYCAVVSWWLKSNAKK